ncbi:hypothetical protein STEG23_015316, partial [Scotinomys teguina]
SPPVEFCPLFTLSVIPTARTWKQPRCPSTEEWIKKMWYIYTMEYYSAEKNNDIMRFAGKWRELENIILSEVTQTQKDKHDHLMTNDSFILRARMMNEGGSGDSICYRQEDWSSPTSREKNAFKIPLVHGRDDEESAISPDPLSEKRYVVMIRVGPPRDTALVAKDMQALYKESTRMRERTYQMQKDEGMGEYKPYAEV